MMNWWLDRGVDGFRMDVINLLSKRVGAGPDGRGACARRREQATAGRSVVNGPRIHEFLQEMHQAVFARRPAGLLTVGETPAASVEDGRLYTDAARAELDMVFQFEHVDLDVGPGGRWDVVPFTLVDLKRSMARWQEGLAERRLEQPLLRQPRRAARGQPLRQRLAHAPGRVREGAGDRAAPAPRHAVRLPGRRARHDQQRLRARRRTSATSTPSTSTRQAIGRGVDHDVVMSGTAAQEPRQRPDAHAVGRERARRLHHRYAVASRQPEPHRDQRRRPGRRPGLGVRPPPAADRRCATTTRWSCTVPSRCCCPSTPSSTPTCGPSGTLRCWSWPTSPTGPPTQPSCPTPRRWLGAGRVLDSGPDDPATWVLGPWAARVSAAYRGIDDRAAEVGPGMTTTERSTTSRQRPARSASAATWRWCGSATAPCGSPARHLGPAGRPRRVAAGAAASPRARRQLHRHRRLLRAQRLGGADCRGAAPLRRRPGDRDQGRADPAGSRPLERARTAGVPPTAGRAQPAQAQAWTGSTCSSCTASTPTSPWRTRSAS